MCGDGEEPVVALPRLALVLLLDLEHADQARGGDRARRHGIVEEQQHVERITVLAHGRGEEAEIVGKGQAKPRWLAALAKEKEEAIKAAKDSGLSTRAFGVYWNLKDDEALRKAGISAMELARDAETEIHRFPNARVNDDERRKLRATLYRPLLGLGKEDRGRIVDVVLAILLDGVHDADA